MPKARKEGDNALENVEKVLDPEPFEVPPSRAFRAAVQAFKEKHPQRWADIALCPTQHGVEIIAEALERL